MILFIFICLLLDVSLLRGQRSAEEFRHIWLRFKFPSFYNSYNKFCCKLYPGGCYKLLDSAGYTCDLLRGRVTKIEEDGWIGFEISGVQTSDAGYYRCGILGANNQIYSDYFVEVFEVREDPYSRSQPALTATTKAPSSPTTIPDSTGAVAAQDHSDNIRAPWVFGLPLAVIASITVVILIISLISVVCYKVKHRKSGIFGETLYESQKQEASDTNGVVYTTVDFRPHQRPEEVYENLRLQRGRARAPEAEHAGMVEYSTLAIQV